MALGNVPFSLGQGCMKGGLGTILATGTPEKSVSGKDQLYFKFSMEEPKVLCEPALIGHNPHTSACRDLASHPGPQIFLSKSCQLRLCPRSPLKLPVKTAAKPALPARQSQGDFL